MTSLYRPTRGHSKTGRAAPGSEPCDAGHHPRSLSVHSARWRQKDMAAVTAASPGVRHLSQSPVLLIRIKYTLGHPLGNESFLSGAILVALGAIKPLYFSQAASELKDAPCPSCPPSRAAHQVGGGGDAAALWSSFPARGHTGLEMPPASSV